MGRQRGRAFVLFGAAIALFAIACLAGRPSSHDEATRRGPAVERRISYASGPSEFGDLRVPRGDGPHPVAVLLHGGCWMARYDLAYLDPLAAALTDLGVATWTVEYRRLGDAGGGWPGTFQDVAAATDFVRTLARGYALDPDRVIALGHSAGGELGLWLAARGRMAAGSPLYTANPLPLRGVVALAAITDLRRRGTACDASVAELMGGVPADAADRRWLDTSPIELLPLGVPSVLVHGSADRLVPPALSDDYVRAARAKGDDVRLAVIDGADHFDVVDPRSAAWPAVREAVLALLAPRQR